MITTIEPLEKISRTSLKFDLITVPEFGNIYTLNLSLKTYCYKFDILNKKSIDQKLCGK